MLVLSHRYTSFFFERYRDHPDLHSFPTRRSSDLISSSIMSKKLAEGLDALVLDVKVGSGAFMKKQVDRSEEHTSELQSRVDLVCHLLLEKKKYGYHA